MPKQPKDEEIEDRIHNEAIVDAHGEEERAIGWYYYLDDKLSAAFPAKCIKRERTSPLKVGSVVSVKKMAPVEECYKRMLVTILHDGDELDVPLEQLEPTDDVDDDEIREAVQAWHYWVNQGYQF
ncbi:MAG: calcium-binding protein [Verrucomicrobiae bacterium]|nr:calcium-binding protein [Verrucomicrobiae bacterium]